LRLHESVSATIEILATVRKKQRYDLVLLQREALNGILTDFNTTLSELGFESELVNRKELTAEEEHVLELAKGENWKALKEFVYSSQFQVKQQSFAQDMQNTTDKVRNYRENIIQQRRSFMHILIFGLVVSFLVSMWSWYLVVQSFRINYQRREEAEKELEAQRLNTLNASKFAALGKWLETLLTKSIIQLL
jgi:hypothetical protein